MIETLMDLEDIVEEEPLGVHRDHPDLLSESYDIDVADRYRFYPGLSEIEDSIDRSRKLSPEDIEKDYFLSTDMLEVSQAIEELQDASDDSDEDIHFIQPD